jgi:hypothetical protein
MRLERGRRKKPARGEIRPLGCREIAGSNLARSNEPLCSLSAAADGANWRVDRFHLHLCTAFSVPVQDDGAISGISASRADRKDPNFFP